MKRYFNNIIYGPFTDVPFETTMGKYDEAIELIVSHWSLLPRRPLAIYQIGHVGVPGLSDLDFVVVFPDGRPIEWIQYQPQVFPNWVQQMMTHSPYGCSESDWAKLPAWYPIFNLRHLWGNVLPEPNLREELLPGCALGMLVDYLIVKVPRDFLWFAWERPFRVRILLAMLHSLKYTVKLAEDAKIDISTNATKVISDVDELRNTWFELDAHVRLERLSSLCEMVCNMTGELITNVDKKISYFVNLIDDSFNLECVTGRLSELFKFSSEWDYMEVLNKAIKHYRKFHQVYWTNPVSFLSIFSIYANECPKLGKYLRAQGCSAELSWSGGIWGSGLRYHAKAMESYSKNIEQLGIPPQKYVALGYEPFPSFLTLIKCQMTRVLNRLRIHLT